MSTNDTLRGLLIEALEELRETKEKIGFRAHTLTVIDRIDAALAEPGA